MTLFNITTTHNAHICIVFNIPSVEGEGRQHELEETVQGELDAFVAETVTRFQKKQTGDQHLPNVSIDDDFCCNVLTEVGLHGTDSISVQLAAKAIATFAQEHEYLTLILPN